MTNQKCSTGKCKPCSQVNIKKDKIDPNSLAHIERNACNSCQRTPPKPIFRTVRVPVTGQSRRNYPNGYREKKVFTHFEDEKGNQWEPDNAGSAWWYHDDPFPGFRNNMNMTFRLISARDGSTGWQCRYENGVLDDSTLAMGTYDYAPAGSKEHFRVDVGPHERNPNYVPNLTIQYGKEPSNSAEMKKQFDQTRAKEDQQRAKQEKRNRAYEEGMSDWTENMVETGNYPLG